MSSKLFIIKNQYNIPYKNRKHEFLFLRFFMKKKEKYSYHRFYIMKQNMSIHEDNFFLEYNSVYLNIYCILNIPFYHLQLIKKKTFMIVLIVLNLTQMYELIKQMKSCWLYFRCCHHCRMKKKNKLKRIYIFFRIFCSAL